MYDKNLFTFNSQNVFQYKCELKNKNDLLDCQFY